MTVEAPVGDALPPDFDELSGFRSIIRNAKVKNVFEFRRGKSTLILGNSLSVNS